MINCPKLLEDILRAEASQDKVRLLFGARQTGKSTLLQRVADANARVFNLQVQQGASESQVFPVKAEPPGNGFSEPALEDLLLFGSLPGVILENEETRVRTLEGYVDLYLEEEILREAPVRNVGAFHQFLELAAIGTWDI